MKHINTYSIFEGRYKSRGPFGRISDFISSRKDMSSIVQNDVNYSYRTYYKFDNGVISSILANKFTGEDYGVKSTQFLKFKEENPNAFIMVGLNSYSSSTWDRYTVIKLEILINDLIEVINNQLEILWIDVGKDFDRDNLVLNVAFREMGFQIGDGMPSDVYKNYVDLIKSELKKKRVEYIKKYNILQRQKTPQKMKHRSIRLYSLTTPGYISKFDADNGIIKVTIDPRL